MQQPQPRWRKQVALFMAGQTLSLFGSSVVSYAVIWYLTLKTSSGSLMTLSILSSFLPQVLITPFAGVWADRYNRKLLSIGADLFIAVATLALALCFLSGMESVALLFAVSAIRSVGSGVQMPAVSALLPELVPAEHLMRVNSIQQAVSSAMLLISPAAGGLLLAATEFGWVLMVDVVTALCGVGMMLLVQVPKREAALATTSALAEMKEGAAYSRSHPLVGRLLLLYTVFFVMVAPPAFLTPLMVERTFGPQVWRLTANEIAWTAGTLLGGVLLSIWGGPRNRMVAMAASSVGFGVFTTALGLAGRFEVYLVMMAMSGMFMPMYSAANASLLQERVDSAMMGRVFAVVQIVASTAMPLGMVLFGPLGDLVPIEWILIGSGLGMLAMGVWLMGNRRLIALGGPEIPES